MAGEPSPCSECGKIVLWDENRNRYNNYYNYPQNKRGDRHIHYQENNVKCNRCRKSYNSNYYYQCPVCFKQACQNCGTLFLWTSDRNRCPRCNSYLSGMVEILSYDPESKKYVTNTAIDLQIKLIMNRQAR